MSGKQDASSSLAIVATVVVGLLLLCVGGVVAAGALFWFVAYRAVETQTIVLDQAMAAAVPLPSAEVAAGFEDDFEGRLAAEPLVIRVDRRGQIRIGTELLTIGVLGERLRTLAGETAVTLYIHPECPYRCVAEIEQRCLLPAQVANYQWQMNAREAEPADADAAPPAKTADAG